MGVKIALTDFNPQYSQKHKVRSRHAYKVHRRGRLDFFRQEHSDAHHISQCAKTEQERIAHQQNVDRIRSRSERIDPGEVAVIPPAGYKLSRGRHWGVSQKVNHPRLAAGHDEQNFKLPQILYQAASLSVLQTRRCY